MQLLFGCMDYNTFACGARSDAARALAGVDAGGAARRVLVHDAGGEALAGVLGPALEERDHRDVVLGRAEHVLELLLGRVAHHAGVARARVEDLEGCARSVRMNAGGRGRGRTVDDFDERDGPAMRSLVEWRGCMRKRNGLVCERVSVSSAHPIPHA
jgi:hypothetical protein